MPPFDGNGIYELPVTTVTPAVDGTTIDSAEFNTFTGDIKTALTLCIAKDGQTASPTITTPTITTPAITGNTSVAGNVTFDASAAIRQVIFDTGTNLSYFQGDTAGDIFLNDGTNARTVWSYDESANEFNVISELNTTNAQLTTPTMTSPVINTGVSGTAGVSRMTQETVVATTSGTTADFTVPSWVKKITIMADSVSWAATAVPLVQIGDAGGIEITGYVCVAGSIQTAGTGFSTVTDGFFVGQSTTAGNNTHNQLTLTNLTGNLWQAVSSGRAGNAVIAFSFGDKTLSGALTTIRYTSQTGATFDAGQVNAIFEG